VVAKFLSMVLFLMPAWALAAAKEMESAADAPVDTVDVVWVVVFLVLFFGMIIGYCYYVWWADRKRKQAARK
jgi:hypothetical protein